MDTYILHSEWQYTGRHSKTDLHDIMRLKDLCRILPTSQHKQFQRERCILTEADQKPGQPFSLIKDFCLVADFLWPNTLLVRTRGRWVQLWSTNMALKPSGQIQGVIFEGSLPKITAWSLAGESWKLQSSTSRRHQVGESKQGSVSLQSGYLRNKRTATHPSIIDELPRYLVWGAISQRIELLSCWVITNSGEGHVYGLEYGLGANNYTKTHGCRQTILQKQGINEFVHDHSWI